MCPLVLHTSFPGATCVLTVFHSEVTSGRRDHRSHLCPSPPTSTGWGTDPSTLPSQLEPSSGWRGLCKGPDNSFLHYGGTEHTCLLIFHPQTPADVGSTVTQLTWLEENSLKAVVVFLKICLSIPPTPGNANSLGLAYIWTRQDTWPGHCSFRRDLHF